MKLEHITGRIIQGAMKVHSALGPGLLESAYRACLSEELSTDGMSVQPEWPLTLHYNGKQVEGIAKNLFNAGLDVESRVGLYLNTTLTYVDKMPVDFANQHYAKPYSVWNAKAGYHKTLSTHFDLNLYGGLDNITDTHYSTHIFLNSRDYPKIYNPMPLSNWYVGTSLKYIF